MNDLEISSYLNVFLDELDEQLQILDEEVLKLEQDGDNLETIQCIFRAAHTLKGSSAAMGFTKMSELTHKIENVFDLIRNQQLKVNTEIINSIFKSIDFIKVLKDAIISETVEEIEITSVVCELEEIKNQSDKTMIEPSENEAVENFIPHEKDNVNPYLVHEISLDNYQIKRIKKALQAGYNVFTVYVSLIHRSLLKSVRAFLIENNLQDSSEIIATFPSKDIVDDEERFNGTLVYVIVTYSPEIEIATIVNSISDIDTVRIETITETNLNQLCNPEETNLITVNSPDHKQTETNEKSKSSADGAKFKVQHTVRVDVERLEQLMNLVGELVIDQTRLADVRGRLSDRFPNDAEVERMNEVGNHLGQVITELQEGMMKTRMLPIEQLFNRFPRMVRDIGQKANKEIDFIIQGKETELDRNLIEEIGDPIIHLLRNSVDHGVEEPDERERLGKPRKGRVLLKAAHEENHIVISISDDGRGIDPIKIKKLALKKGYVTEDEVERLSEKELLFLIFKSGVSTASQVTDISGRGVGMDIVRSHIEKLNGLIDISSSIGEGTCITIKLPLTLAIIRSLLVKMGTKEFAIPLANVQEIVRLRKDELKFIKNQEVGIIRDRVIPLVRMHNYLNADGEEANEDKRRLFVVVVGVAEKCVGLVVDLTLGNQDIVIKPLGKYLGQPKYIAGATIMGDGKIALILDVGSIVRESGTKDSNNQDKVEQQLANQDDAIQLATFKLGVEEYGIEIDRVKDIITVPSITKVMNAPYSVLGMINLRGKSIPVMDLRQRFDIQQQELDRKSRIMVVEFASELVGILVDQVSQVLNVPKSSLESPPDNMSQVDARFITSICNLSERLIILLDINLILDIEELKILTTIVEEKCLENRGN